MQTLQGIEHYLGPLGHFLAWPCPLGQPDTAQVAAAGLHWWPPHSSPLCPLQQVDFVSHGHAHQHLALFVLLILQPGAAGSAWDPLLCCSSFLSHNIQPSIDLHSDTATAAAFDCTVNLKKLFQTSSKTCNCLTLFCISFFCPALAVVLQF